MVEAVARGPWGKSGFAELREMFLEAVEICAGVGIAGRDGAAGAGIAAFEVGGAETETNNAAFVWAEKLIFPESGKGVAAGDVRGRGVDFEAGAKAEAGFFERDAGKPFGDGAESGRGDDGGAVGDGVIGEAVRGIANEDLLLEENAEPFGGVLVGFGEGEGAGGDAAAIAGDGESDAGEIGRIVGADEMDCGSTLAVDPAAIDGIKSPGAVESEAAGRTDGGGGDGNRVEGLDGVKANVGEDGDQGRGGHEESLAGGSDGRRAGRVEIGSHRSRGSGNLAMIAPLRNGLVRRCFGRDENLGAVRGTSALRRVR
jgi:hypothetical protein